MAVARAQGQGGVSAVHIWLIIFVALWLTSTVLLVILYLDQEQHETAVAEMEDRLNRVVSSQSRNLPQFAEARAGTGTAALDLLEAARSRTAELISGDPTETSAALQTKLQSQLERVRANQFVENPAVFEGVGYAPALSAMFDLFVQKAEAHQEAVEGINSLTTELNALRQTVESQKTRFDEQAEQLQSRVADVEQEAREGQQTHEEQIASFDQKLEQIKAQCSEDIQSLRSENARWRRDYEDLLARYQELKDKLGQARVKPVPLGTAREADGTILKATPGDDVVYIDLGRRDHISLGLEFAVYDSLEGIPEDGRAKARIEVVRVNEQSAECRIVEMLGNEMIMAGDIVANPIYDRQRTLNFYVMGEFDLDGDGRIDPAGRKRIETMIGNWGGKVADELSAQIDFVVMGAPPSLPPRSPDLAVEEDINYQAAKRAQEKFESEVATVKVLAIPTLPQGVLLNFLGYDSESRTAAVN